MSDGLTQRQLNIISDIERVCSVISLIGCVFIIVTFCASSSFHKPINRLVFYASFGNMMTNVGTLMSRSYLHMPDSPVCQFQGFLIQMFMPADAFWTLAMAFNVYLTFYHKYDARKLRRMEIPYLLFCYGIPFIPAFVYIFLKNKDGYRAYGNATLWCWITTEWDIFRIATFYGPVWVVIFATFFIYIRAGRTIYEKHKQLNDFHSSEGLSSLDVITTLRTTEVTVTTSEAVGETGNYRAPIPEPDTHSPNYSVHISANTAPADDKIQPVRVAEPEPVKKSKMGRLTRPPNARRRNYEINNAAWAYAKCSILFFTALLVTWIPSSANRVYSVVKSQEINAPLEIMSAFVLPLQGFWNALIYGVTSWGACKSFWEDLRTGKRPEVMELVGGMGPDENSRHSRRVSQFRPGNRSKGLDSESMTELANTRTHSADAHSAETSSAYGRSTT
ncbi:g- coupled receptor [Trichoderma arundinaceum]|uniref:G-coupled receptor n=1 Tax=Trichoderma arundinaceum TaxID=490622 RepID=A0A395NLH3_TRIAR|nr:g- coupled receptor [Trichoderma arundinaceum]